MPPEQESARRIIRQSHSRRYSLAGLSPLIPEEEMRGEFIAVGGRLYLGASPLVFEPPAEPGTDGDGL